MNLRKRPQINYQAIHSGAGEPIPYQTSNRKKEKWSTSKLYCVEIIDERTTENGNEVKVHYPGYDRKYDEWKAKEDIVDRDSHSLLSDALALLKHDLSVKIKENLNVSRLRDPEITIHIPLQQETFEHFLSVINADCEQRGMKTVYRCTIKELGKFLPKSWWYRICNEHGDFAYVVEETIAFWQHERQCLVEFKIDRGLLKRHLTHRGFHLVFRFVKALGNRSELDKLI